MPRPRKKFTGTFESDGRTRIDRLAVLVKLEAREVEDWFRGH